ncbi:MAG TPA: M1 family aminopeptidase [Armatimonadota bacterium]|nr:M1 family aminopeptidase [Armatimonadota bacterium]
MLMTAAALAAAVCVSTPAPAVSPDPALPILKRVVTAANESRRSDAASAAITKDARVFGWIPEEPSMFGAVMRPTPWAVATLKPPFTNSRTRLAVFHSYHGPESDGDHIHPLVETASGWRLMREIPETDTQGYRITAHNLRIRILPKSNSLRAVDTLAIRRTGASQQCAFVRISNDFTVRSIRTATGKQVPFLQAGGIVSVRVPAGDSVTLTFTYDGKVSHSMMSDISPEVAALNAYHWPHLGRLPATTNTTVIVPANWTAITQGELVSKTTQGADSAFVYDNRIPVNYQSICAGPYVERSMKHGRLTLYTYLLNDQPEFSQSLLEVLAKAMDYYEQRFGPYPYTRYSLVDGGKPLGFVALEGYSMASYGSVLLTPAIIAHELSHTWWGGVAPNTYLRSWWNEAFASYSDDSFSRFRNGITTPHPSDRRWWPLTSSVSDYPLSEARHYATDINGLAYQKGMVVLRLLELRLGADKFDESAREFLQTARNQPDPGWKEFQKAVEKITGENWDWFFRQWVERAGWPELRLRQARVTGDAANGFTVTARLGQTAPYYRLEVPVRLVTDGPPVDVIIPLTGGTAPVSFETRDKPLRIVVDPEFTIPRDLGQNDTDRGDAVLIKQ